jgi:hypothetical protein
MWISIAPLPFATPSSSRKLRRAASPFFRPTLKRGSTRRNFNKYLQARTAKKLSTLGNVGAYRSCPLCERRYAEARRAIPMLRRRRGRRSEAIGQRGANERNRSPRATSSKHVAGSRCRAALLANVCARVSPTTCDLGKAGKRWLYLDIREVLQIKWARMVYPSA